MYLPMMGDAFALITAYCEAEAKPSERQIGLQPLATSRSADEPTSAELPLLHRITFGLAPNDAREFANYATSKMSAFEGYVTSQLAPEQIDDSQCETAIANLRLPTIHKSAETLWREHIRSQSVADQLQPLVDLYALKIVRAVQSKCQLKERLAEFWFDHFNIYGGKAYAGGMLIAYERDVIRPNVLGNFRQFLGAVAHSTSMLHYLDNVSNIAAGPNENYARELLELHTLGAAAYGTPDGYSDVDVVEVARCLTGWTTDHKNPSQDTGAFLFDARHHDNGVKHVMGQTINVGGEQDGERVLDIIATHPATARHIATKLCRYFIQDRPPTNIIDIATQTFLEAQNAPDQLAQVVGVILHSAEYRNGQKFKRPFETIIGVLRAGNSDFAPCIFDDQSSLYFYLFLNMVGHHPYGWAPPNGYPDVMAAWETTNSVVMRWRFISWLTMQVREDGRPLMNIAAQHPANARSATEIIDFWIGRIYGYPLAEATRQRMITFMAQGRSAEAPLPIDSDLPTRERLHAAVGLLLMLPDYHLK